ncbi:hypothetical protein DSCO28_52250 [Desulfosarcina ovata subsp. sediminis]|uniref:TIR domain-containing protein n=1 Tax=Desulfosarcina ovata subsp. sediminis TaxID=885957 RepID=A0A5K7ZWM4_9BACT|nr:AAA-like domain-containing protein [Desulfosarcina ovata]BBO84659.1 hypothetical protein DSCO28_52250 [Desulfosarcina ovata subsp. sediminis]
MDPITSAIVAFLAAQIPEAGKLVVKDAYNALKTAIRSKFGKSSKVDQAVQTLESEPGFEPYQNGLADRIRQVQAAADKDLIERAQALTDALNQSAEGRAALSKYNVTIDNSEVGVIGDHAHVDGGIHFHYHSDGPKCPSSGETAVFSEKQRSRQNIENTQPANEEKMPTVFISYAREDQEQAKRLYKDLKHAGTQPWLDVEDLLPGQKWRAAIRQTIRKSDFVVILLSSRSISKQGFVQAELNKAMEVLEEIPADDIFMIPARLDDIRVSHETLMELNHVDLFPDWEAGLLKILKVIIPNRPPGISGRPVIEEPRPYVLPHDILQPGGAMDVDSRLYIRRQADADVLDGVSRHRGMVTLQGPRQTGKTSMLLRLYADARKPESPFRPVIVDFQGRSGTRFGSLATIWQAIVDEMDSQLGIGALDDALWNPKANYDRNVTGYLDRFVFAKDDNPVLLCLDEVDRVFSTPVRNDFFPSVRAFFNRGAYDPAWKKMRWLLSTSSEPRFFIDDLNQSPFNVGRWVTLGGFSLDEVEIFSGYYGFPQDPERTRRIMTYAGGRPFLVHLLLHHLALAPAREQALFDAASAGDGVFKSHLDRYLAGLQANPDLAAAMRQVLAGGGCADVRMADRLAAAGLIREDDQGCWICACDLYAAYLEGRL